jgi:hypothetical protein
LCLFVSSPSASSCTQTAHGVQTPSVLSTTNGLLSLARLSFASRSRLPRVLFLVDNNGRLSSLERPLPLDLVSSSFQLPRSFCLGSLRAKTLSSHLFRLLVLSSVLALFRKVSDTRPSSFPGLFSVARLFPSMPLCAGTHWTIASPPDPGLPLEHEWLKLVPLPARCHGVLQSLNT